MAEYDIHFKERKTMKTTKSIFCRLTGMALALALLLALAPAVTLPSRLVQAATLATPKVEGNENFSLALSSDGTVYAWGANKYRQSGTRFQGNRTTPVQVQDMLGTAVLTGVKDIAAGRSHALALKSDGTVWSWGSNNALVLGAPTSERSIDPDPAKVHRLTESVTSIAAGFCESSFAVTSAGTVYAWGANSDHTLGTGGREYHGYLPALVKGVGGVGNLSNIKAVAVGYNHTLFLTNAGTVYACGSNNAGQLGINALPGITPDSEYPVQVLGGESGATYLTGVTAIAAGKDFSMALMNDGSVYAWGWNYFSQLGTGDIEIRRSPARVKGGKSGTANLTGITAITAARNNAFALKTDGTVYGWGSCSPGNSLLNARKADLDPKTATVSAPSQMRLDSSDAPLAGITAIGAGDNHCIVVDATGRVRTWGSNTEGQLGDGTTAAKSYPTGYLKAPTPMEHNPFHLEDLYLQTHTVTFNYNGGGSLISRLEAGNGSLLPKLQPYHMPTRDGYTFMGYYDTSAAPGGVQYYSTTGVPLVVYDKTASITLYARWAEKPALSVRLYRNDGTGDYSVVTIRNGMPMPTPITIPSRPGYTFAGYFTASEPTDGTQYYTAAGASAKNYDLDFGTNLYASWIGLTYTVTFDRTGGTGGPATETVSSGKPMPKITPPMQTGRNFIGYWDTASGVGTQYYTGTGDSARNWNKTSATTLYARWTTAPTYNVGLGMAAYGGTGNITAIFGEPMPAITLPNRPGYTYDGSYDSGGVKYYNADGSSARNFDKTAPLTLTARYVAKTYTVTLSDNGGTGGSGSVTVTYNGSLPTPITLPTRDGCIFEGYYTLPQRFTGVQYYTAAGASSRPWNIASDTILHANWTKYEMSADFENVAFPGTIAGYGEQQEWTVSFTNRGTADVSYMFAALLEDKHFEISSGLNMGLVPPDETVTLGIRPKTGLAAGTYTDTLKFTGYQDINISIPLSFTVSPAPVYAATIDPPAVTFFDAAVGYGEQTAQKLTITNTGAGMLSNLEAAFAGTGIELVTDLSAAYFGPGETFELEIRPKTGLALGTHTDTLTISNADGIKLSVALSFTVSATVTKYQAAVNSAGAGHSGSGSYTQGTVVPINAGTAPAGQAFDKWESPDDLAFANPNAASTTFIMLGKSITVTAVFKPLAAGHFAINVLSGTGGVAGADATSAAAGTAATLTAVALSGFEFKKWEVIDGDIEIAKDGTFIMPAETVTVKAIFEPIGSSVDRGLKGDATGDGNINIFDILAVRDHIFRIEELEGDAFWRADCNNDGEGDDVLNIFDILAIRDYIFGLARGQ